MSYARVKKPRLVGLQSMNTAVTGLVAHLVQQICGFHTDATGALPLLTYLQTSKWVFYLMLSYIFLREVLKADIELVLSFTIFIVLFYFSTPISLNLHHC